MNALSRNFRYLKLRMLRDQMPVNRVAAGWAIGMFVGCAVPFGLQLIVSIPLALLTRTSKVGATLGTFITNPLTILFIYPAQTWVGAHLLGANHNWASICDQCRTLGDVSLLSAEGWHTLAGISGVILGGFFLGGFLLALVCTPLTYFAVRRIVTRYRSRRGELS